MIRTVFVVGPTASGKTEYAIRLAEKYDGEIVSADSMQIYRYMDIGSAKPTAQQQPVVLNQQQAAPAQSASGLDFGTIAQLASIFLKQQ